METKKRCSRCRVPKPLTEFHKKSSGAQGVVSACKECRAVKRRCVVCGHRSSLKAQAVLCNQCKTSLVANGQYYCTSCKKIKLIRDFSLKLGGVYHKCKPCMKKKLSYQDRAFGVIAPRYVKPPVAKSRNGETVCDRCPSHLSRCRVYVKLNLPLDCEKVSKSDIIYLGTLGEGGLREVGWLDRTQVWTDEIWERYYEAVKEIA